MPYSELIIFNTLMFPTQDKQVCPAFLLHASPFCCYAVHFAYFALHRRTPGDQQSTKGNKGSRLLWGTLNNIPLCHCCFICMCVRH